MANGLELRNIIAIIRLKALAHLDPVLRTDLDSILSSGRQHLKLAGIWKVDTVDLKPYSQRLAKISSYPAPIRSVVCRRHRTHMGKGFQERYRDRLFHLRSPCEVE